VAFTKDQDIMDASLVDTLHYLGIYGLIMLATVITVSITIPMFSIFAGVLFIVTFIMLWFYLPAATKLKKHKVETGGEDQSQTHPKITANQMLWTLFCSNSSFLTRQ
jgi:hypothetical protein